MVLSLCRRQVDESITKNNWRICFGLQVFVWTLDDNLSNCRTFLNLPACLPDWGNDRRTSTGLLDALSEEHFGFSVYLSNYPRDWLKNAVHRVCQNLVLSYLPCCLNISFGREKYFNLPAWGKDWRTISFFPEVRFHLRSVWIYPELPASSSTVIEWRRTVFACSTDHTHFELICRLRFSFLPYCLPVLIVICWKYGIWINETAGLVLPA